MKKTLLFTLRIHATDVPVWEEESPLWGTRWGIYEGATHSIRLRAGLNEQVRRITLLHELAHAGCWLSGTPSPEGWCDMAACILHQLLTSGPELVAWLREPCIPSAPGPIATACFPGGPLGVECAESALWSDGHVLADLPGGRLLVEAGASPQAQRRELLACVLQVGAEALGASMQASFRLAVAGAAVDALACRKAALWLGAAHE